MAKIKVLLFPNGNSAVFENGEQVPALQVPWLLLFVEHLERAGVDPRGAEIILPDARKIKLLEVEGNWNWRVL